MNLIRSDHQKISRKILDLLNQREEKGFLITEELSSEFEQKSAQLYPILHLLEDKGILKSRWKIDRLGKKRKFYSLARKAFLYGLPSISLALIFVFRTLCNGNLLHIESLCIFIQIHRTIRYGKDI